MSLICTNFQKSYGTSTVLKGGTLVAQKGEITGLIGKNGAGKSTTFKIITGLLQREKGQFSWNDLEVDPTSIKWKSKLGYLAEHNPVYKSMYIKEFLKFACEMYSLKNSKDRIDEVIVQTGLTDYANRKIVELSKGYRQRVGIAQSIINDPEVLILDEPTSGLDPSQLVEIRSLIKGLSKDRVVILSSHILSEVEQICNSVYLLKDGVVSLLNGEDQFERLRMRFSENVDASLFESIGQLLNLKSDGFDIELYKNSTRVELFDCAVQHNLKIVEMSSLSDGLMDQFIQKSN